MNSKTLINETLKYLKTENNKPKYRFEIYTSGIEKYYRQQLSNITFGIVPNNSTDEEKTVPVSVYTIGDIFDTIGNVTNDVIDNIEALPDTLDNIKVSLKQLGFQALDSTIEYIKAAVVPIEMIQDLNRIYRVAKPLVQKIVNIASIRFHFENAALVGQDVLQYLKRLGAQTAKNALSRLWEILMDTPIFAIYENDDSIDLTKAYSTLSDAARDAIDRIARNTSAFGEILSYINDSDSVMYEPKYNSFGIAIKDNIVDVYSDPHTRKIYIASRHDVYSLNEDYTTTKILHTEDGIFKIYFYANEIYYITTNNDVKKNETTLIKTGITDIVFSEPLLISDGKKIYTGSGAEVLDLGCNLVYHCYDSENDVIYFIGSTESGQSTTYTINSILKDELFNYTQIEVAPLTSVPEGLSYYNNSLYIVFADNSSDEESLRRVYKTEASSSYISDNYEYENYTAQSTNNIIWTDGEYATNGQNIFRFHNNDEKLTLVCSPTSSINCVTTHNYNGRNYFVCSGGNRLYVSLIADNGTYKWNDKLFETKSDGNSLDIDTPENMAGCLWFEDSLGDKLIVYSQEHIYVVGPNELNQIFNVIEPDGPENIFYKEFASFEEWYNKPEELPEQGISCSSITEILDGCIITGIRKINGILYVSLFSTKQITPESDNIKSGIYPAAIITDSSTNYIPTFVIDYDHPVFSTAEKTKIYSFNQYADGWYYTDGRYLYCPSKNTKNDLGFTVEKTTKSVSDGVVLLSKISGVGQAERKKLYTFKAILNQSTSENHAEISTIVNYQNKNIQIASTKNVLMISNGNYVYNLFDDADNKISSELFQICYNEGNSPYRMIQSNDAIFIISGNKIRKVPLYSEITSSNYGCGYYTDTAPHKWYGAAPYYFASNVLNFGQNNIQKDMFLLSFKENFKVELEKLLRGIPNAFVTYTQNKLVEELKRQGVEIDGDDGQIVDLIINSVASTTANSLGMYVQEKFAEKIGNDSTYNEFALAVYNACRLDKTNNMTKDFYDIFEELYYSIVAEGIIAKNLGKKGMSNSLLRYYQNHKAEWAESMTSLIDVDIVDPDIYEIPLKSSALIPQKTYKFIYDNNGGRYEFDYISSPYAHYDEDNIIKGYYYNNKFYSDSNHTQLINNVRRDSYTGDYYDSSNHLICYHNSNDGKYYRYKIPYDYVATEDTLVNFDEFYYEKLGSGEYTYTRTTDTTENPNKQYYNRTYALSNDKFVVSTKDYFAKSGIEYNYERLPDRTEYRIDQFGNSFYEKVEYSLTTDTALNSNKVYYIKSFAPAVAPISPTIQYYKLNYVPTKDTQVNNNKTYFEIINLSNYDNTDVYYEYNPESSETKYSPEFTLAVAPFDADQDYYTLSGGVYNIAYNVNEQGGPYYIISDFSSDADGTYIEKNFTTATAISYYSEVINPSANNLAAYYEIEYEKISTPNSLTDVFYLVYNTVTNPSASDISTYYEKVDKYIQATDINYIYDPETGNPYSIVNDRNYYKRTYVPDSFYKVTTPSGNPYTKGYYEYVYNPVLSGTFTNPKAKGYYERWGEPDGYSVKELPLYFIKTGSDPDVYEEASGICDPEETYYVEAEGSSEYVEADPQPSTINPKEEGWYEVDATYSTLFEDKKLYIDLEPTTVESSFPVEDAAWHKMFYDSVKAAKTIVSNQGSYEQAKAKALELLNVFDYKPTPSWKWQHLITSSVSEYYIPTQGEQYRRIVYNSNMYPIQWNELPEDIDQEAFDYALTALLYEIKQRLAANITLLVDGGKVKCYSCIDAATVIQKMISRNAIIWNNQIKGIKAKVNKATDKGQVVNAFNILVMPEDSLSILEEILNNQSELYAKYIDMIIEEQVINDNISEVSL